MTDEQKTSRDLDLVKLIERVKRSPLKPTAIKVEMEGRIGRTDRCGVNCKVRRDGEPHVGCKNFSNVRIAHDFALQYLVQFGLAERVGKDEQHPQHSFMFKPKYPCRFSKIYTDSETEWTITIDLKEPENVLLLPHLIDAFNHLAKANRNGAIDVKGSGMHMAFLQGENGMYPSEEDRDPVQQKRFENFAKSMTPLLPALYLLGANRTFRNKGITRSLAPRMPQISHSEKYSAVAYRYGAVEFRVFDTCYDNREQILDNAAVMARSIAKYWRKTYRDPGMKKYMEKPIYFGGNGSQSINNLDDLFMLKEHIVLLNAGLQRIKPTYLTVKEIKAVRKFKRNGHNCHKIDVAKYETVYTEYLNQVRWENEVSILRDLYYNVEGMSSRNFDPSQIAVLRRGIAKRIKDKRPVKPIEMVAYEQEFGAGFVLGGN